MITDKLTTIVMSAEQRALLISKQGEKISAVDQHGRNVSITIENWKGIRLYVNFYVGTKRVDSAWISLNDDTDMTVQLIEGAILFNDLIAISEAPAVEVETVTAQTIWNYLESLTPAEHTEFMRRVHAPMTDEERDSINDDFDFGDVGEDWFEKL